MWGQFQHCRVFSLRRLIDNGACRFLLSNQQPSRPAWDSRWWRTGNEDVAFTLCVCLVLSAACAESGGVGLHVCSRLCVCGNWLHARLTVGGCTVPSISPSAQKLLNPISEKKVKFQARLWGGLLLSRESFCRGVWSRWQLRWRFSSCQGEWASILLRQVVWVQNVHGLSSSRDVQQKWCLSVVVGAILLAGRFSFVLTHVICFFSEPGLKPLVRFFFQLSEQQRNRIQTVTIRTVLRLDSHKPSYVPHVPHLYILDLRKWNLKPSFKLSPY